MLNAIERLRFAVRTLPGVLAGFPEAESEERPAPGRWTKKAVAVTLAAPQTRAELDEDLRVLDVTGPLRDEEYATLAAHGERVKRSAGGFR